MTDEEERAAAVRKVRMRLLGVHSTWITQIVLVNKPETIDNWLDKSEADPEWFNMCYSHFCRERRP